MLYIIILILLDIVFFDGFITKFIFAAVFYIIMLGLLLSIVYAVLRGLN